MDTLKNSLTSCLNHLSCLCFLSGIEVWGAAYQRKHLDRIDNFFRRSFKNGYISRPILISDIIKYSDKQLFEKVCDDVIFA